ncbi:MAG: 23S rRNA (uracil(1939)-C(5))-methyltransferase RlmD [Candidatus Omnitrophota bacterium]|jgi:23S rRNA (uracil1939-C5)-methyltransferase|nr:MAG: 23S rRNA (uracil(1939)-C(5))-methyltransferase RlmD [Candidatus Omnitrophota bacterium]
MEHTPSSNQKTIRTVRILRVDKKGRGVGETETGGVLTIPFTIPGERVEAVKLKRKEGRLLQILEASPHRTAASCSHFSTCGGCTWQHIDYGRQLHIKKETIAELCRRHGIQFKPTDLAITPSAPFEYRNRMDFVWWNDGRFGLRQRGKWHSVVNLQECRLLPHSVMNTALEVNRRVQNAGLPFCDQVRKTPGLRYLVVRRGVFTGEIMLLFVSDSMHLPPLLWQGLDRVVSVYQLINDNPQNDTSDGIPVHLAGNENLRELIGEHPFSIGPRCFFQPNPAVAQRMVMYVRDLLSAADHSNGCLLDLFCGVGLFTASTADLFQKTMGIEFSEEAVSFARRNAAGLAAEFLCKDAGELTTEHFADADTLIVDPPRDGIPPRTMKWILTHPFQEIIYISCNPRRGIEDAAKLLAKYNLQSIRLFDQFPQTPHVEMIAHFRG